MKKILCFVIGQLIFWPLFAQQSDVDKLIDQGIALHDHDLYEDAIKKFNQALKLDKKNLRARYEIAYCNLTLKNWDEAIFNSYEVIEEEADYYLDACMVYGAALDSKGKGKAAIRFYKKVLKDYSEEYLLYYNLALTQYNQKEYDEAQESVQKAIQLNKAHMSSHLLLSSIMQEKGERLRSMLPLYYFLLFEQDDENSVEAHTQLQNLWTRAAIKDGNSIAISMGAKSIKSGMMVIDLAVGAIAATYMVDEEKMLMEQPAKLANQTKELFSLMAQVRVDDLDFFAITYGDFFNLLTNNGHAHVFSHYISNCVYKEKILAWLTENNSRFLQFMEWMGVQE